MMHEAITLIYDVALDALTLSIFFAFEQLCF